MLGVVMVDMKRMKRLKDLSLKNILSIILIIIFLPSALYLITVGNWLFFTILAVVVWFVSKAINKYM